MSKILIVEDEESIRWGLARIIENNGHTAVQSRSGRRAMGILEDNKDIDLVITDVRMPDGDGRELIQIIRANPGLNHLPVLMISGKVGPKEIADVLQMGATAFLPKPVNAKNIKEYLTRYLDNGPQKLN